MWAALRLRLLEAQRRGGLLLLGIAFVAVLAIALFGGETVDGRYGLATDVAATLGYVAAVFVGAFPLAIDRERKRSYLPAASPVAPWQWALGNSAAAAIVAATFALTLYVAAAIGAAAGGGVETWAVTRVGSEGMFRLRPTPQRIHVPADTQALRLSARTFLVAETTAGTSDTAVIGLSGKGYEIHDDRPVTLPVVVQKSGDDNVVIIRNRSPEYAVGIDIGSLRALTGRRAFFPNSLAAGIAPALGAGALAALGAAVGAHLGPPIAALALTLLLLLGSLKGFLLDVIEYEGTLKRSESTAVVEHHGHTHGGGGGFQDNPLRAEAKRVLAGILRVVPAIGGLDRTGAVATGEWIQGRRIDSGLYLLLCSLAVGAVVGGLGVHLRRTP
jgi:hypothetical protein